MIRFTEERYDTKACVRIVNPKQCALYMKHGVYPIDFYAGGNNTLVYVFVYEQTKELYEKWLSHELD